MIMKRLYIMLGLLLVAALYITPCLAENTLDVTFDKAAEVTVGNDKIAIDGEFKDGMIAIGGDGFSFPAKPLFGDNSGTILFACKFDEPREPFNSMRTIVTLRTNSRLFASFYWLSNKTLLFACTDSAQKFIYTFKDKIVPGRLYQLGVTWNGNRMRLYLDGLAISDTEQLHNFSGRLTKLNIGPYADAYYVPGKWTNDTYIKYIRTAKSALAAEEIAKSCGVTIKPLVEDYPMLLTIPPIAAGTAAPTMDGQLDEAAWNTAASMPRLIQGNFPHLSGELPPHDFRLTYDKDNLYLGFTTLFPPNVQLVEGEVRTPDKEPEAWGSESFEFWLQTEKIYRFAGNVAGGYCEGRIHEKQWDGKWTYRTSLARNIDDSMTWQGEVSIPWATLELDGPPKQGFRFNFCRSWKIPQAGNFSSLNITGAGYVPEAMISAVFAPSATMRVHKQSNPNNGDYEIEFQVASARGGNVQYELAVAKLDGSVAPMPLNTRQWNMKAGEVINDKQNVQISQPDYDCLLYTLKDNGKAVMREIIPFRLDENFFDVRPYFLHGNVRILLKSAMMHNKLGKDFQGRIILKAAEGGAELSSIGIDGAKLELPFDRNLPGGKYTISLTDMAGVVKASKEVFYPGIQEWQKMTFPKDVILPPFIPMKNTLGGSSLTSEFACRTYSWEKSPLPVRMVSMGEELFAAAPQVMIGGTAAHAANFKTTSAAPHRVDFISEGRAGESAFKTVSWLEYDGVQWNELEVDSAKNGTAVALTFEFPAEQAKFLHCAGSSHWGHKITRTIPDGVTTIQFYPIIWLGCEERGFCFFVEEHANWNAPSPRTYTIEKKDGKVFFKVAIAEKLKVGAHEKYSFGIMATPVRPLAENYPFDTFGWGYTPPMNRPGRRPTNDVVLINFPAGMNYGNLGAYYADCDDADGHARAAAYSYALEHLCRGHNVRPIPYLCGHYLQDRYPEMRAYRAEWCFSPEIAMDYNTTGDIMYDCCPASSSASAFICWRIQEMLKRYPDMKGVYFDFGNIDPCSNEAHGCKGGLPILGQREFYRRVALTQYRLGIKSPVIVIHNTDCNMFPTYPFVTHLLNGEQLRQQSSTTFHNKKDILDKYGIEMFASELSTLPIGVTNSVYMPLDTLMTKYGGDEDTAPYQFRMGRAEHAATLLHNTIIALERNHFGFEDKIIRILDKFGVDKAKFIGYWRQPAKVTGAEDIYISCHVRDGNVLAVVSHVGKPHVKQTFEVTFDCAKLGIAEPPTKAVDKLPAPDPEYDELFKRREEFKVPPVRAPLELGDFGSTLHSYENGRLKITLDFHCFALIELTK